MEILKIENVVKAFGENHVLNKINLSFNKGKIYTIIGGNNTGKTTLYNLITEFLNYVRKIYLVNIKIMQKVIDIITASKPARYHLITPK